MSVSIITTDNFRREAKKLIKKYRSLRDELQQLSEELEENPKLGTLITENVYKIRLAVKSKGKGKSGGLRIITYVDVEIQEIDEDNTNVYLLSIYDKSDYENISDKQLKSLIDDEWAYLVYSGLWQDPLKADLDGFIEASQKPVSGSVKLKLYKGSLRVVGRKSKNSLYNYGIATYGSESTFDQRLAKGFVELWGMQTTEANKLQKKRSKKI